MARLSVVIIAAAALAAGCPKRQEAAQPEKPKVEAPKVEATPVQPPAAQVEHTTLAAAGLDLSALDRTADPCTDFYQFACGGWLAKAEIPSDKSRWSRSFSEIDKRNEETLRDILEEARTAKTDDPVQQKLGAFYGACMDEAAIEAAGTKPVDKLLGLARSVKDAKSVALAIIELHRWRVPAVFDIASEQDFKEATKVIAYLDQSGLGLPDRDYYINTDDKSQNIRKEYLAHVDRMLKLAGLPAKEASASAQRVMALETELAKVSKTRVERRDPAGLYNKIDRAGVAKAVPAFPWDAYFKALGSPEIQDVVVTSVPFFEGFQQQLAKAKVDDWRAYLQWHVIRAAAPMLSQKFVDESFALTKVLTGQAEVEARWKRCVDATDRALGELLAQPYVAKRFAGGSKDAATQMVLGISRAFGEGLDELAWMDAETRGRAHEKLASFVYHIGYPPKWKAYDWPVTTSFGENVLASRAYELKRDLAKIGKPLDRQEWLMSPPTVNAYYNPLKNEMVFPAGILQPPFYSSDAAIAVNMGAMGMVVGHELTHGFDDEGSKFAADGNLKNWWTEGVEKQFQAKTQCVADQYAQYEAVPAATVDGKEQPAVKLNGKLTLGENIADIGGVKLAFKAYRAMRKDAPTKLVADGFTEDQLFFLSVGQAWCTKATEQIARMLAQVDPHSPPKFRVNGSLTNVGEFAEAFQCRPGSAMAPANRCDVW